MIVGVCLVIALLLLLAAALGDVVARTVPNRLCLAIAADGLTLQFCHHILPLALMAALAVFVPAMLCWRRGLMGGGDVKLLGAAALLVPPVLVPMLVLAIALAGGVLGLLYWGLARLLPRHPINRSRHPARRILRVESHRIRSGFCLPYAVAICIGTVAAIVPSLPLMLGLS